MVRQCQERWIDGEDEREIAQDLRAIRKDFAPMCFDLREMTSESRLASARYPLRSQVAERYFRRGIHTCR